VVESEAPHTGEFDGPGVDGPDAGAADAGGPGVAGTDAGGPGVDADGPGIADVDAGGLGIGGVDAGGPGIAGTDASGPGVDAGGLGIGGADAGESELAVLADTIEQLPALARTVEALLFLSADPLDLGELADATRAEEPALRAALELLAEQYAPGLRGIQLRELAGGYTLATDPATEDAARRLYNRPRATTLSPAQAETLAIVAYLQPISRPEITRIRGVSADSAAATLLERGLVEEAGRSQFGATLYRTSSAFLKLFGLRSLDELPDVAQWDPTPEEQSELRERLLRAGEARAERGPGGPE
jgi:segregation and condensation protein B